MRRLTLFLFVLSFGCSASNDVNLPTTYPDTGKTIGGGSTNTPDTSIVDDVSVADGVPFSMPFAFSGSSNGVGRITSYSMTDNVGTVQIDGRDLTAAVYERQPFGEYVLYQTLIAESDRWWIAWFYCRDDVMEGIYSEGTNDGPLVWQPFQDATCSTQLRETTSSVALPAPTLSPDTKTSTYEVSGPDITIAPNGTGQLTHSGTEYSIAVFEHVDCTTTCGVPGWYELHAILESQSATCFGIFYLNQNPIQLAYVRCLPGFVNPIGTTNFEGTWFN